MNIYFEETAGTFHLQNSWYSYIMKILPNHQLGHLYFGSPVRHRRSFDYLLELANRTMSPRVFEGDDLFSLEQVKQEFPSAGSGDYRQPAVRIIQGNGSRICDFAYDGYKITKGKPELEGLPAVYCEADREAATLHIFLKDRLTGVRAELLYTVFEDYPALARSVRIENAGTETVMLDTVMSLSLDLPDADYEFVQLSGAWCRERFIHSNHLRPGVQSIGSRRGHSSHQHNPFIVLKRPQTDEHQGQALGISLVYSGNFLASVEVDNWDVTRICTGIDPDTFCWKLEPGQSFQTPEAVLVYTENGMNAMSQAFHGLYRSRLARGYWRDRPRPILLNNWEATMWHISEEEILRIAAKGKEAGAELFVLDDGWSKDRDDDISGLGDWTPCRKCLPHGISGLSERIRSMGLSFGLWFEPEMLNRDSDLFRAHPEWVVQTPGRSMCQGRNEFVLDYSRPEVVDYIFRTMSEVMAEGQVSYVKWDMNRSITEAYSAALPADRQGEFFHRYILGVYALYDHLAKAFPQVLFESCASGGGRFDPGLLYYAPQGWTSDCSDAVQRVKIQYGTSLCYPISCMGAHVSKSPNLQIGRNTPLKTRANVAYFGTFGYEMDLGELSGEEMETVKKQVLFMKKHRRLIQFGTFYRLLSPFENEHASWMVVSPDRRTALVGWYKSLNEVNGPYHRIRLAGLDPDMDYVVNGEEIPGETCGYNSGEAQGDLRCGLADSAAVSQFPCRTGERQIHGHRLYGRRIYGGDELMNIGLITTDSAAGECLPGQEQSCDFDSRIFLLESVDCKL